MSTYTVDVTDVTFESVVLGSDKIVLVEFWATWCGPCKALAPVLDEIACEHENSLRVAKIDIDANSATTERFGIMSVPTMIVFKRGEPVSTMVGPSSKAKVLAELSGHLS